MNNTQTKYPQTHINDCRITHPDSHLIVEKGALGNGDFMHVDEWDEVVEFYNSGDYEHFFDLAMSSKGRYKFLSALLPTTLFNPYRLEEIFTDYDACKALLEIPEIMRKDLVERFKKRRRNGQSLDELDKEGREIIEEIISVHRDRIAHSKKMQQVRSNIRI